MAGRKSKSKEYTGDIEHSADTLAKNMDSLMSSYNRSFNKDNPMVAARASDLAEMGTVQPVSTRHISFDLMTGIGGLPCGKIIEFTGEEGSHKSNMAWECVGAVHQSDPYAYCVWIDAEKAIDIRVPMQRRHILNMHVDLNRLFICVPDTAEQCWRMISMACDNGATLVVLDSISALIPKKEYDDVENEKAGYPALPAAINKGFRQLSTELFMTGTTLIEINQVRENLEVAGQRYVRFEDRWKSTGGKGLKHWLTLRLMFKKAKKIWAIEGESKRHIGDEVEVMILKTRLAPIRDRARLFMYHSFGFDSVEEVMNMAIKWEILYKEKKTSRNYLWDGQEDFGAMSWDEWYEYLESEEEALQMLADAVAETYEAYYDENAAISEEADELEEEYDEEEDG